MFFLVDTRDRERPERPAPKRLPRWLAVVVILLVAGLAFGGIVGVIALFTAVCLLVDRVLPSAEWSGLRDYRQ